MQALWAEGARRFAMPGLAPIGCLPVVITLYSSNAFLERGCIDRYSTVARDFNVLLQAELLSLQTRLSKKSPTFIGYINAYDRVIEIIRNGGKSGQYFFLVFSTSKLNLQIGGNFEGGLNWNGCVVNFRVWKSGRWVLWKRILGDVAIL